MIGKYFFIKGEEDNIFYNLYYVESLEDEKYNVWLTGNKYTDQPGMCMRERIPEDKFLERVENKEILEIEPPTLFIVTKRNTYEIKEDLKRAGAQWSMSYKFWWFDEKPEKYKTKEVLVFPYTGKKISSN
ncbi:hypothetical protein [Clostridium estertheticum]|uniref:Uncharacterized protein n=1 Tax=Clostridium estertheticum subsp. estertheticum TaxID=1552 RepID=A0A1J0GFI8_9CLOT|nr:hypothetical protein [Clostridium estertheticum]APC39654.1 hypothetical protein A7L45_06025 [Clostridium estertheticum subsp. estertheticum]MBZ9614309.1 hypothetical protein [Clostridium estertheticum subsp. laramiense]WAG74247.1 hypothetical protein LL032_01965 [Clostridium estertheticum]